MGIDGATELYGIIGNPVAHSLSPAMHNAAFQALGLNKVYVAFPVADVAGAMTGLRALGVKGASVTIPHKQAVIPFLDAIDPVAARIGAVNTLVVEEGIIRGLNTDWVGANRALAEALPLAGKTILVLGAGGSARAIGFGLLEEGARVLLASRTPEKGRKLASELGIDWLPLAEAGRNPVDAVVNATSVGMAPAVDASPLPQAAFQKVPVVMDIVYSPLTTRLLREAREAGCQTVDGLAMLLYQGVAQFEAWTGLAAPVDVMREVLMKRFG